MRSINVNLDDKTYDELSKRGKVEEVIQRWLVTGGLIDRQQQKGWEATVVFKDKKNGIKKEYSPSIP